MNEQLILENFPKELIINNGEKELYQETSTIRSRKLGSLIAHFIIEKVTNQ